jgi:hypothetical protein
VPPTPGYLPPGADAHVDEPVEEPEPEPVGEAEPEPTPEPEPEAAPRPEPEPAPTAEPTTRVTPLAWLAAAPAIVAIVGAVLPWFAPTGTKGGVAAVDIPKAFCLQAGRVGFLAPLALIVAAVAVLGPRLGLFAKGQPTRRLDTDGLVVAGSGLGAALVLGVAWYFLPDSYTFSGGISWDSLSNAGFDLQRQPQPGYFISIAAAVIAIGCGVAMVVAGRREPA